MDLLSTIADLNCEYNSNIHWPEGAAPPTAAAVSTREKPYDSWKPSGI